MMDNMERTKPSHYDVYPVYVCHKCDAEHQQTLEETIFPAGILCYCGEKLKLETIQEVNVEAIFKNEVSSKKDVVEGVDHSIPLQPSICIGRAYIQEGVVSTLVGLGYKSTEAKSLVAEFSVEDETSEELFEKIIARS